MTHKEFLASLSDTFILSIRAEGFRGSGSTFRRVENPVCHVFNLQAASGAAGFYINLGVHLGFLPPIGGGEVSLGVIRESQCALRQRVNPRPPGQLRWHYSSTQYPWSTLMKDLRSEWLCQAEPFWSRYRNYPSDFELLVSSAIESPPRPFEGLQIARIARELGLRNEAITIASSALDRVAPAAKGLQGSLHRLLQSLGRVSG